MSGKRPSQRIFIVSELYYPEETSTGYFVTRIAEGLAAHHPVVTLCAKPTYSERHLDVPFRETRRGVDIRRLWSTRMNKDSMIGRILNLVTFTVSVAWRFVRIVRRDDIVICLTNPPLVPLMIAFAARLKGARSVLLVHDLYPEVLVATGHLQTKSPVYRVLYRIFAATYRLYDRVIVLGRDMQALVARKIGEGSHEPVIIPNWGDVDEIRPMDRANNPFARAHDLVGKTVIQFSGNLGRTHDLETVIRAAEALADEPDIVFLFAGYGGKAHLIDGRQGGSQLPNVRFVPRQPREMLGPMLACSDATIIAFVDDMLGVSVPSRMYNIMAAGVPIIAMCDPASELALTVTEQDCGWVLDPGSDGDLVGLIGAIHSAKTAIHSSDARQKGVNGRQASSQLFNKSRVIAQFDKLLNCLP